MSRYTGRSQVKPLYNTYGMKQEDIDRMCQKSKMLFNAKWRWRKLCVKAKCDYVELEKRLDLSIERIKKNYEQLNEKLAVSRNNQRSQHSNSERDRQASEENDGQEIRSGQADDGTVTTESTE